MVNQHGCYSTEGCSSGLLLGKFKNEDLMALFALLLHIRLWCLHPIDKPMTHPFLQAVKSEVQKTGFHFPVFSLASFLAFGLKFNRWRLVLSGFRMVMISFSFLSTAIS